MYVFQIAHFRASTLPRGTSKVGIAIVLCPHQGDSNCSLWEEALCSHGCVNNTLTEQDLFSICDKWQTSSLLLLAFTAYTLFSVIRVH